MKYLALDLETTGLDWEHDQILEVGMVVDDFRIKTHAPPFHCYVAHEHLHGHPVALAMNAEIIGKLASKDKWPTINFVHPSHLFDKMYEYLRTYFPEQDAKIRIPVAGKNVAFDKLFLSKIKSSKVHMSGLTLNFGKFGFISRALDPGPLYTVPGIDEVPPGLPDCCKRAGISLDGEHTAVGDCMTVIRLLRHYYDDPVKASAQAFAVAQAENDKKDFTERKTKLL